MTRAETYDSQITIRSTQLDRDGGNWKLWKIEFTHPVSNFQQGKYFSGGRYNSPEPPRTGTHQIKWKYKEYRGEYEMVITQFKDQISQPNPQPNQPNSRPNQPNPRPNPQPNSRPPEYSKLTISELRQEHQKTEHPAGRGLIEKVILHKQNMNLMETLIETNRRLVREMGYLREQVTSLGAEINEMRTAQTIPSLTEDQLLKLEGEAYAREAETEDPDE